MDDGRKRKEEEESREAARGGTGRGGIARRPTARPTSQRDWSIVCEMCLFEARENGR